jgi:transposase
VITIGIDPHSRTHVAAALDDHGRVLAELAVGSNPRELDRLARWIAGIGTQRIVAIEGARGFGLALCRRLQGAGETIIDVAPALTVAERRSARRPGKDDRGDAVAVARVAMREQTLPRVSFEQSGSDLKLLVDARDQLVAEATRTRNRLHALLLAIAPGYHEHVRDLTSSTALMVARRLASRARTTDRVRSTLACAAIARLRSLSAEMGALEREITASLDRSAPANLLAICGVGPLVAAKILGEVRDVGRFSSPAAFASYSGTAPIRPRAGP